MFKKILIANRGEITLRIIRTCKEMGIKTVAVYSTADKHSLHARFADEAVCIGSAASSESYLNIPRILAAAVLTNADAIHPGYGFLSENSEFSRICEEHNIKFIGASPKMIQTMGDKATAKKTMKQAKVPVVPGSSGVVSSIKMGKKVAQDIGFPVLLKATAGGGGRGMRVVRNEESFDSAWQQAQNEARGAFGNDALYIEKYILEPRHIEIQVAGDRFGKACHLSERECSIQRRHQKLLEETPSCIVDSNLREKMGKAAIKAAEFIKYEGCGTIEFLVDKDKNFYFMEMNTRIQVEHPITEEVTGFDLIKEQIKLAAGIRISGKNYYPKGHAIECRINAEDPYANFRPAPGKITHLHLPGGRGIRIDTHVYAGYTIPPYYDSMIAKVIAYGQDREESIARMRRVLEEFVIEGLPTTIPMHLSIMDNKDFIKGRFSTSFLDENPDILRL